MTHAEAVLRAAQKGDGHPYRPTHVARWNAPRGGFGDRHWRYADGSVLAILDGGDPREMTALRQAPLGLVWRPHIASDAPDKC